MPTEYFLDQHLDSALEEMLSDEAYHEFGPLRTHGIKFLCAFALKTNGDGERQPIAEPVAMRRIGPADRVFVDGDYKLYVCRCRWEESDDTARAAMLHSALMRVEVEVDPEKNTVRLSARKPDVSEFQATVARFGAWHGQLIELRDNLRAAQNKKRRDETARQGQQDATAEIAAVL